MLMNQVIPEWTSDMDNLLETNDKEYEKDARTIVKSLVSFLQNPAVEIDSKQMNVKDFDKINEFIAKLGQIGNLTMPKSNDDRYLIISTALFIKDNGWDMYRNSMVARKNKK